jgi:hypothetical protein
VTGRRVPAVDALARRFEPVTIAVRFAGPSRRETGPTAAASLTTPDLGAAFK